MSKVQFQLAQREQIIPKIALDGPSGSGKTKGALALATVLAQGKPIALLDTENRSASIYADAFTFDALAMNPPYLTTKYLAAIEAAVEGGYGALILDSITHQWNGEGGILDRKGILDARGGNSYANWQTFTKEHNTFRAALLNAPLPIIATLRSKQSYAIEQDEGRSKVRKLGLAPEQRDGMEYEFSFVLSVGMNHRARLTKGRDAPFADDEELDLLDASVGSRILSWWKGDLS